MLTAKLRSRQILPGSVVSTVALIVLSALVIILRLSVVTFLIWNVSQPYCVVDTALAVT